MSLTIPVHVNHGPSVRPYLLPARWLCAAERRASPAPSQERKLRESGLLDASCYVASHECTLRVKQEARHAHICLYELGDLCRDHGDFLEAFRFQHRQQRPHTRRVRPGKPGAEYIARPPISLGKIH